MKINGTEVVNSKKKLVLHITAKDVELGQSKNAGMCAAARALCREYECEQARVHIGRTYLKMNKKWVRYNTPAALRSEIVAFDRGGKFDPGTYTLMPLAPSQQESYGARQGSNKPGGARDKGSKNRTPKFKRAKPHIVTGIRARGANR